MNWSDEPTCKGWWWCFPSPECEWYEKYSSGCVVQVLEDDGRHFDADSKRRLYLSWRGYFVVFTGEYTAPVFGKWCGPITPPILDADEGRKD